MEAPTRQTETVVGSRELSSDVDGTSKLSQVCSALKGGVEVRLDVASLNAEIV